jgi:UDP-N-acetylglucosamine/UDP-N-acetylgalactosamine diphosphorylase
VGPCRLAFGTVVAAGTILRKDEIRTGRLLLADNTGKKINMDFVKGRYHQLGRIVANNLIYIANLMALKVWYGRVRSQFISENFSENLYEGLKTNLNSIIFKRMASLKNFCLDNSEESICQKWSEMEEVFHKLKDYEGDAEKRDAFLGRIEHAIAASGKDYISVIKGLPREVAKSGASWLQGLVDDMLNQLQIGPQRRDGQGGR